MVTPPALAAFLLNAKRRTYTAGGNGAGTSPLLPGSRQLEYGEADLLYRDIYFGSALFVGQETVYAGTTPVWAMSYAGGIRPGAPVAASEMYGFLRAALQRVEPDRPYRGPSQWHEGQLVYTDTSQGSIGSFHGVEVITCKGDLVYQLNYSGGLLR